MSWPGRLAADVDDIGSFHRHCVRMGHRRLAEGEKTAIREAVRRYIEDAHDQRPSPEVGQRGGGGESGEIVMAGQ